jgi:hypothetical protein
LQGKVLSATDFHNFAATNSFAHLTRGATHSQNSQWATSLSSRFLGAIEDSSNRSAVAGRQSSPSLMISMTLSNSLS